MKMFIAGAVALAVVAAVAAGTIAFSQQSGAPARPSQTAGKGPGQLQAQSTEKPNVPSCLTQYTPTPGQSAITMINAGYEIKAAVPNGLWLQKDKDVYYCNSGRPVETDAQCWRLREVTRC